MVKVVLPSQEELLAILHYDPDTGELRRKETGKILKARAKSGHRQVGVGGKVLYAHRVIWKMMTGQDPAFEIDHANCDPGDNRWSNLRLSTRAQNNANRRKNKNNTSGFKGVKHHACGRWNARITVNLREMSLGLYDTPEEAHRAYEDAAIKYAGEFARAA